MPLRPLALRLLALATTSTKVRAPTTHTLRSLSTFSIASKLRQPAAVVGAAPLRPFSSSSSGSSGRPRGGLNIDPAQLHSLLNDPKLSGMLNNPLLKQALSDPAARSQMNSLLSNPELLEKMMSNPLAKMMMSRMDPEAAKIMADPKAREGMRSMMADNPHVVDAMFDAAKEKMKEKEKTEAATSEAKEAQTEEATIIEVEPAVKSIPAETTEAAPAQPASTASVEANTTTPPPPPPSNTDSTSSSSSSSAPPPPPPSSTPAVPSSFRHRFDRLTDLLLGLGLGYLLYQLGAYLLDHPPALDVVTSAAEEDPLIQEKVGSPVKASLFWSGNVNPSHASLVVPVSGPKGKATVHARACFDPHEQSWKLMLLQASVDGLPQKHSLNIPDKYIIKPRYVSVEEADRIRKRFQELQKKMEEKHGKKAQEQGEGEDKKPEAKQ